MLVLVCLGPKENGQDWNSHSSWFDAPKHHLDLFPELHLSLPPQILVQRELQNCRVLQKQLFYVCDVPAILTGSFMHYILIYIYLRFFTHKLTFQVPYLHKTHTEVETKISSGVGVIAAELGCSVSPCHLGTFICKTDLFSCSGWNGPKKSFLKIPVCEHK